MEEATGFAYYGGKMKLAPEIVKLIARIRHGHYVEPFFGSGAVFFNKPPSKIETINDLDGEVVNFFKCLRDHPAEIIRAVALTPYARDELTYCCGDASGANEMERARRFIYKTIVTISHHHHKARPRSFALTKETDNGASARCSVWGDMPSRLEIMARRIKNAQIENMNALEMIDYFDVSGVLFYLDPPYHLEVRSTHKKIYVHESSADFQDRLLSKLAGLRNAKFIISGYSSPLYEDRLAGCQTYTFTNRINTHFIGARSRRQVIDKLWTNAEPNLMLF